MMRIVRLACFAAAAAVLTPTVASAAVTYDLTGSFGADTDDNGNDETYVWAFSFTTADFVTMLTEVTPSSCTITGSFYACGPTQTVDPIASGFTPPLNLPYLGFNVVNLDGTGGGTSFYFFAPGAYSQPGLHVAQNPPPGSNAGNAGPATLLLTGQPEGGVPEPATWLMMITGFAMIGAASRRRGSRLAIA